MTARQVTHIDKAIGLIVRSKRKRAGLTLDEMAKLLGLSYQQFHKYENGTNRISGGMLYRIAYILAVHPGDLFPAGGEAAERTPLQRLDAISDDLRNLRNDMSPVPV